MIYSSDLDAYSRREFLAMASTTGAGLGLLGAETPSHAAVPPMQPGPERVFGLKFSPLDKVRVGFVGVGNRGLSLLGDLLAIEGVEIKAVCDIVPERVRNAQTRVAAKGQPEPAGYTKNETAFEELCRREDIDLVYIATPWDWHVPMAVSAMKQGKHAAVEVPAAITLNECRQLMHPSHHVVQLLLSPGGADEKILPEF